ncbi:MAG: hypothetical protein HY560_03445 [Gemmatimonadetes bacterium]|nr:hypothetical protein [Gemmatimonadota bacterium]
MSQQSPVQRGSFLYRLKLELSGSGTDGNYGVQQVVAEGPDRVVVVTVYTFSFQEGKGR